MEISFISRKCLLFSVELSALFIANTTDVSHRWTTPLVLMINPCHKVFNIYLIISHSLIIHEENTKEINTETDFGYVMKHLHKIKPTFISIFSLNTDLFDMLDLFEML